MDSASLSKPITQNLFFFSLTKQLDKLFDVIIFVYSKPPDDAFAIIPSSSWSNLLVVIIVLQLNAAQVRTIAPIFLDQPHYLEIQLVYNSKNHIG